MYLESLCYFVCVGADLGLTGFPQSKCHDLILPKEDPRVPPGFPEFPQPGSPHPNDPENINIAVSLYRVTDFSHHLLLPFQRVLSRLREGDYGQNVVLN